MADKPNAKQQGKPKGKGKKGKKKAPEPIALPEFAPPRNELFASLYAKQTEEYAAKAATNTEIEITLPDGAVKKGIAWKTTPLDIAKSISDGFSRKQCVSEVNGKEWDLARPLEGSCSLVFHNFSSPKGQHTYWHTSAHILGEVLEQLYGAKLCTGPPIEQGFYYDVRMPEGKTISSADFKKIEQAVNKVMKKKQEFQRLWIPKGDALKMFGYTKYKTQLLNEHVKEEESCSIYACGDLTDVCTGPHLPHSGWVKSFHVYNTSSAYWKANANNDEVTRVYGISFQDKKEMKAWKIRREEAKKRDHRLIGQKQELFFFHPVSPGSCFFLPHGTRIYNKLISLMRGEYKKRGFTEVVTPNVFKVDLWKTSGHWANYKENMFQFECEKETYGLKPMNCPGHCMIFKHRVRSYRELPLRLADFGVLHRNELSGTLGGLTRVRRFQQDDAHIFCTADQISSELEGAFAFLKHVYGIFGFKFNMELSTRPEKFLGDIAVWNKAEETLRASLNEFMGEGGWALNEGDGAFYGPKIDVGITDAIGREYQCATIQLDFQLPLRFELEYTTDSDTAIKATPVIIHRAILGSVERMFAILTEHLAGKWPFWLSPRQAIVIPVGAGFKEYALEVQKLFGDYHVDIDMSGKSLDKKVRTAQMAQYNYILVVGQKEKDEKGVDVRKRDEKERKFATIEELQATWKDLVANYK